MFYQPEEYCAFVIPGFKRLKQQDQEFEIAWYTQFQFSIKTVSKAQTNKCILLSLMIGISRAKLLGQTGWQWLYLPSTLSASSTCCSSSGLKWILRSLRASFKLATWILSEVINLTELRAFSISESKWKFSKSLCVLSLKMFASCSMWWTVVIQVACQIKYHSTVSVVPKPIKLS